MENFIFFVWKCLKRREGLFFSVCQESDTHDILRMKGHTKFVLMAKDFYFLNKEHILFYKWGK